MRVAVHFPADHELAQDRGGAVVAYKLGRIEDGVHNAPVGHEPIPLDEFVAELVRQAREEYPDANVVVERLVRKGSDEGRWIPAEDFDPDKHEAVGAGQQVARDVSADLSADGAS